MFSVHFVITMLLPFHIVLRVYECDHRFEITESKVEEYQEKDAIKDKVGF